MKLILREIWRFIIYRNRVDFLFLLNRPEFRDFIEPLVNDLEGRGYKCLALEPKHLKKKEISGIKAPLVVITASEYPEISNFLFSKKVLLPHSIFIRDTTPTPLSLGNIHFLDFDFYFAPNIFWFEWILKSLSDIAYYSHLEIGNSKKFIILGGNVKKLPPKIDDTQPATIETPLILYAPSVFSQELPLHRFHLDGLQILLSLARAFPRAKIVCRPHPTDMNRDYVNVIASSLTENSNIYFDLTLTPNIDLYSKPDIVITDLSGFAFTHQFVTTLRPIFIFDKQLSPSLERFTQLATRFGDVASDVEELIGIVDRKLKLSDTLEKSDAKIFRKLFLSEINNKNQLINDLIRILKRKPSKDWIKVPFLFDDNSA